LVTEEQYLGMIEGKTSVLLAFSLQAGAMLAGVKSNITKALYAYGLNTGLAFQVMDDYLDTFGSQASFGKRIGGDILENKKTLLWIEAQKRCSTSQLETLQHWYKQDVDSDDKIKAVTALFKALEIDKYTKSKVDYYFNEASKNLSAIKESYNTEALEALGTDLNVRNT
jgi:geranylgeranyl diphosphate synthase type II